MSQLSNNRVFGNLSGNRAAAPRRSSSGGGSSSSAPGRYTTVGRSGPRSKRRKTSPAPGSNENVSPAQQGMETFGQLVSNRSKNTSVEEATKFFVDGIGPENADWGQPLRRSVTVAMLGSAGISLVDTTALKKATAALTAATAAATAAASSATSAFRPPGGLVQTKSAIFHLLDFATHKFDGKKTIRESTVDDCPLLKAVVMLLKDTEAGKDLTDEQAIVLYHNFKSPSRSKLLGCMRKNVSGNLVAILGKVWKAATGPHGQPGVALYAENIGRTIYRVVERAVKFY